MTAQCGLSVLNSSLARNCVLLLSMMIPSAESKMDLGKKSRDLTWRLDPNPAFVGGDVTGRDLTWCGLDSGNFGDLVGHFWTMWRTGGALLQH